MNLSDQTASAELAQNIKSKLIKHYEDEYKITHSTTYPRGNFINITKSKEASIMIEAVASKKSFRCGMHFYRYGLNNRHQKIDASRYFPSSFFRMIGANYDGAVIEEDIDISVEKLMALIDKFFAIDNLRVTDFNSMAIDFEEIEFDPDWYTIKGGELAISDDRAIVSGNRYISNIVDLYPQKTTILCRSGDSVVEGKVSKESIMGFKVAGQFNCDYIAYNGSKYCYVFQNKLDWKRELNNPRLTTADRHILNVALGKLV